MANLAAADVTYTPVATFQTKLEGVPPRYLTKTTLTFGDGAKTYPSGGIPLIANSLGFPTGNIEQVWIIDPTGGGVTSFTPDASTFNLRAYRAATNEPVIDEVMVVTSNVGTFRQKPCHVFMVFASAGSVTGPTSPRLSGATVATAQCAINYSAGTVTFFGTDAVTEARVSYLPAACLQRPTDLVVEETVTVTANVGTLANQACLIGCVEATVGTVTGLISLRSNAATPATKQAALKLNSTGATTVTFVAGDAVTQCKVTYVKATAFPTTFGPNAATIGQSTVTSGDAAITCSAGISTTPVTACVPAASVYCDSTAGTSETHLAAPNSASLSNGQWSFYPYPSSASLTGAGPQFAVKSSVAVTAITIPLLKAPLVGPLTDGQLVTQELNPGVSVVPPSTLVVFAVGF